MSKPQPIELKALDRAGTLLQFAAENKKIPDTVASSISACWDAVENNAWTPEISAKFWNAYDMLSAEIRPVTIDTISCNEPTIFRRKLIWWRPPISISESKSAATFFLNILIFCLLITLILQFSVSTAKNTIKEVDNLVSGMDKNLDNMREELANIQGDLPKKIFSESPLNAAQRKTISKIQYEFRETWIAEDTIAVKLRLLGFFCCL
jgi:hypothetical protein